MVKRQALATVCQSNECRYGACEIVTATQYKCHCNAGITGTNCDTMAAAGNPCSSNPCYNGGICVNQGTSFICTCPNGLAGSTCRLQTAVPCPCQNGATCNVSFLNGVVGNTCTCPAGFGYDLKFKFLNKFYESNKFLFKSGELCQFRTSLQTCQILGCQNGGTCTILATCKCPPNFTGCGNKSV